MRSASGFLLVTDCVAAAPVLEHQFEQGDDHNQADQKNDANGAA
jgi:hypothetical protein